MPRLDQIIFGAALVGVLVCAVIACAAPVYTKEEYGMKIQIKVFESKVGDTTQKTSKSECKTVKSHLQASGAFAILTIFACVGGLALVGLEVSGKEVPKMAALAVGGAIILMLTVVWGSEANLYTKKSTDPKCMMIATSMSKQKYKYGGGFILAIVAWVIMILGTAARGFLNRGDSEQGYQEYK